MIEEDGLGGTSTAMVLEGGDEDEGLLAGLAESVNGDAELLGPFSRATSSKETVLVLVGNRGPDGESVVGEVRQGAEVAGQFHSRDLNRSMYRPSSRSQLMVLAYSLAS